MAGWKEGAFVDWEEWIKFETYYKVPGWIEAGTTAGEWMDCCSLHPFYAQDHKGYYEQYVTPGTIPAFSYYHYRISDPEVNGNWHIWWNESSLVKVYGGWPEFLEEQEAGMEVAANQHPYEARGRQLVAASDEGEWWPWKGAEWYADPPMCITTNPESSAAGNISYGAGTCG